MVLPAPLAPKMATNCQRRGTFRETPFKTQDDVIIDHIRYLLTDRNQSSSEDQARLFGRGFGRGADTRISSCRGQSAIGARRKLQEWRSAGNSVQCKRPASGAFSVRSAITASARRVGLSMRLRSKGPHEFPSKSATSPVGALCHGVHRPLGHIDLIMPHGLQQLMPKRGT